MQQNSASRSDTLKHPVLVTYDDVHLNFGSAVTQGVDTSQLVISSLRALEQGYSDELSKNVFKA